MNKSNTVDIGSTVTCLVFLISSLVLGSLACRPVDMPVIETFSASDNIIMKEGVSTTLSWNVTNATNIKMDQNIGNGPVGDGLPTMGTIAVSPASTTTYTLIVSNKAGISTKSVTITVALLPDIVIFDISPHTVHWTTEHTTENAVMRWEVHNATIVKITHNQPVESISPPYGSGYYGLGRPTEQTIMEPIGSRSISITITPILTRENMPHLVAIPGVGSLWWYEPPTYSKPPETITYTYTLEATNANGTVTKTQTLEAVH